MNYRIFSSLTVCLVLGSSLSIDGRLNAAESDSTEVQSLAAPEKNESDPPTHSVTREPIRIEVTLQGVVEAERTSPISIAPEVWTQLQVDEAVEHGARVRTGEPLIKLETDRIDEAIEELETTSRLSELSLEQKRVDVRHLEKTLPLEVRSTEISRKQAREDLDHFQKIGRDEMEKSAEFTVKKTRNYLEYQKEELRQLEKMYGADDLTEETEEIILKRQRDAVEIAIFSLERAKVSRDQSLQMNLPRQAESLKTRAEREDLQWEKARLTQPMALEKQRLEVASLEHKLESTNERLEKLRRDRSLMTITAPTDGVVYYGQFERGKWSGAAAMIKRLRKGGVVQSREVLMTVVQPRPFVLRATVPEKDLGQLNEGSKGRATPSAYPETRLPARISWLSDVPVNPGSFEALIELGETAPELLPGMTCSILFTPYENPEALTVPSGAVFDGEAGWGSSASQVVFVMTDSGEHQRRVVKTGRTVSGKTEIVEGLKEGERVLLERPRSE